LISSAIPRVKTETVAARITTMATIKIVAITDETARDDEILTLRMLTVYYV